MIRIVIAPIIFAAASCWRSAWFIAGFALAYFFAPLLILTFVTAGAAIGATLGFAGFGIAGPYISRLLSPVGDRAYSSWDYGFRTANALGNQNGLGIAIFGVLSLFGLDKCFVCLKDLICHGCGLVVGAIGSLYDAYHTRKAQSMTCADFKEAKAKILFPWSQIVNNYLTLGGFAGSAIGFGIGTLVAGPIGGGIGAMIGTGVGALVSAGVAALWGEAIYLKYAEISAYIAKKLTTTKKKMDDQFEMVPPKTKMTHITSTQKIQKRISLPCDSDVKRKNGHVSKYYVPTLQPYKVIPESKQLADLKRRRQSSFFPDSPLDCNGQASAASAYSSYIPLGVKA